MEAISFRDNSVKICFAPSEKKMSKRKEFTALWSKFFPFRIHSCLSVVPFSEERDWCARRRTGSHLSVKYHCSTASGIIFAFNHLCDLMRKKKKKKKKKKNILATKLLSRLSRVGGILLLFCPSVRLCFPIFWFCFYLYFGEHIIMVLCPFFKT